MNEDIIRNLILAAEKIRHQCIGSSNASECLVYIRSNNEIMIVHDNRVIFRTFLKEVFEIHPEIAYYNLKLQYNEDKSLNLDNLDQLELFDIKTLNVARSKYSEYVEAELRCPIYARCCDLATNTEFQNISQMKAGDGLKYFSILATNGTIVHIPYFVGLFGLKKADMYGIIVYDFDTIHYLVKIIDKKPKLDPIDIFMCILKGV